MAFNPAHFDLGSSGTIAAAQTVSHELAAALLRYEDDKKKREFNQGAFEFLSTQSDSSGKPLVTPEILQKWHKMNPDQQAGTLSGLGATLQQTQKEKLVKMQIDAQNQTSPYAGQKIYDDSGTDIGVWDEKGNAHLYPGGSAKRERLYLTDQERADAERAGVVPLRQSDGSFQYREDPNSPINQGGMDPVPIADPRDPTKFIGLRQPNGTVKYFPRSSSMQELVDLGYMTPPAAARTKVQPGTAAPPSATPAPASSAAPAKVRVKRPDGQIGLIPADQLSAALAAGYQPVQ
jgi:hypothetical protein